MTTVTFDTHKFVKQLEAAGIAPAHAEAFVSAQRDILSEALDTQLATKADIQRLENRIDTLDTRLTAELTLLKWMLGVVIAIAIANFAKQFF
ncbi:MAG: hypothetical protein A2045_10930 [Rhodocyclales bacterium GWA2_65_20]|nr:MAG: hypothetical protein A2045_10930 [Rhodocyclales bacterium GWA2_65_20]